MQFPTSTARSAGSGTSGWGTDRASQPSARLATSTAKQAATAPTAPSRGVSPSSAMPTAAHAAGVTAAMIGSVTMGRPVW